MSMKRTFFSHARNVLLIISVVAVVTACPLPGLSQEGATVRVLNISASGMRGELTDERLIELARDTSDVSSRWYPELETLMLSWGDEGVTYIPGVSLAAGPVDVSGALGKDGGFNFTSVTLRDISEKCDLAIVGFNGSVRHLDEEVIIDYDDRTISTTKPVLLLPDDVMFLFVRETKKMYTEEAAPPQGCG